MAKAIGIISDDSKSVEKRLFQLLSAVFECRFERRTPADLTGLTGLILVKRSSASAITIPDGLNTFQIERGTSLSVRADAIEFANSPLLRLGIRGQKLPTTLASVTPLADPSHDILAHLEGHPVWTRQINQETVHYRVTIDPTEVEPSHTFLESLDAEAFVRLIPLFHFLRRVTGNETWQPPPLRASIIIDDPNLRTVRYGRIDYRFLLERAKRSNFHIAMAMVPLDGWQINEEAADLFRRNSERFSLLIHGNDHVREELAQKIPHQARLSVIADAVRRIQEFERKARLKVLRIMVPPHGACSEEFMAAMLRFDIQGCAANIGPWLWKTHHSARRPAAALGSADIHVGGFPVLNRFRFKSPTCAAKVAMSAFFGRPIIAYGHHNDLEQNGLDSLDTAVRHINSLGDVRWMDLQQILHSNFWCYADGETLHVRMFSRLVRFEPPSGIRRLAIQLPDFTFDTVSAIHFSGSAFASPFSTAIDEQAPVEIIRSGNVEIRLLSPILLNADRKKKVGLTNVTTFVRRGLAEARDRLIA